MLLILHLCAMKRSPVCVLFLTCVRFWVLKAVIYHIGAPAQSGRRAYMILLYVDKRTGLVAFSSEEGEMHVALGAFFQVDKQVVGTSGRIAQIVVQGTVVEQQP